MGRQFTILIADRNSHVRRFLEREMLAEGYQIRLAENGREVLKGAYECDPLDLIILDPDLPDTEAASLLKKLQDRIPPVPVVVHAFASERPGQSNVAGEMVFVEKRGNSVERLKQL
ncbi:MAG: response regulator, partial [Desulfobacterales bacterium]